MEVDLDYKISHDTGENAWWNLAFEVWLTEEKPGGNVADSITDEIMIWFDWKDVPWDPKEEEWEDAEAVQDGPYGMRIACQRTSGVKGDGNGITINSG